MNKSLVSAAVMMLSSCVPLHPAYAQIDVVPLPIHCGPRKVVLAAMDKFKEQHVAIGLNDNNVVELWLNKESGTFSILLTRPDGISCLVLDGSDWQFKLSLMKGSSL